MTYKVVYHQAVIAGVSPEMGWMYPLEDNQFSWFVQCFNVYHKTYQQVSKKFDVAIQAGGHCGIGPKVLSSLYKTVYTFEPNPNSFHCLVNNCQDDNIIKFNACLGKEHKLVYQYFRGQHNVGVSLFKDLEVGIEPTIKIWDVDNIERPTLVNIPQIRIDDLGLESCDLIHLDVEGYEGKVIEGGIETIKKFKPAILYESMDNEPLQFLFSIGYTSIYIDGHSGDTIIVCN